MENHNFQEVNQHKTTINGPFFNSKLLDYHSGSISVSTYMNCPSQGRRPCEVENILLGWPLCDGLPGAAWDWEVSSRSSRDESRGRQSNADADNM